MIAFISDISISDIFISDGGNTDVFISDISNTDGATRMFLSPINTATDIFYHV